MRKNSATPELIARLQQGPLCGDDWKQISHSRHTLHQNIYRLRQAGWVIDTVGKDGGPRVYHLIAPPDAPTP